MCKQEILKEKEIRDKYAFLTNLLIEKNITITTMESCTAGQIASLITDTEGSSAIIKGAFIAYSNETKIRLGVPENVIERYGVYSEETAKEMAEACRKFFRADIGVGVTGSFGNADPDNPDSIPGEVFFAIASDSETKSFTRTLPVCSTRLAYKLCMADLVAECLENLIAGWRESKQKS